MTIKLVNFEQYQDDITAMMRDMLHLEPQTVDIPVERYIELQSMGILKPFMWFDGDVVKGVALIIVAPSLRNNSLSIAQTDVIWVKPEYRGASHIFAKGIEQALKGFGVDYWYAASRYTAPINRFLERNGFKPIEKLYFKEI